MRHFPDASYVRDACTRKHILANHYTAEWNGLKSIDNMIGVTPDELWVEDIMHRKEALNLDSDVICNERCNLKLVQKLEDQLILNRSPVSINLINIRFNGLLRFEKLIKIPVLGFSSRKVVAFLTTFCNLTHQLSLNKLFQLYQEHYSKQKAIRKTLEHLEVSIYFSPHELPTCKELQVLFAMCSDSRRKAVARKCNISATTASNYISNLQEKVRPLDLHHVLLKLREMGMEEQTEYKKRQSAPLCVEPANR